VSIAALVAMHRRMGTDTRRRKAPKARFPTLVESDYAKQLVEGVKAWRAAIRPLLDELPALMAGAESRMRADDIVSGKRARVLIDKARYTVTATSRNRVELIAQRVALRTAAHNKDEMVAQAKAALGIDIPINDRRIAGMAESFAHENTVLVEKQGQKTLDEVEKLITKAFARGTPVEELNAEIAGMFATAENNMRWFARDQVAKFNASVAEVRREDLGLKKFEWVTMNDRYVRHTHRERNRKVYPYSGAGAPPYMPGEEFACRCVPRPIFDEIRVKAQEGTAANRFRLALPPRSKASERGYRGDVAGMRVVIAGGPRSGKTTLAATMGEAKHTDDIIDLGWSEASSAAMTWFDAPGPWVIEGVATARALRKWLDANPQGKPCDVVFWMPVPHVMLAKGQSTMLKGCEAVWRQVEPELVKRGVEIR
jgi:SPP1 gp7 family putative phage head morphogenesis protein